MKNLIEDLYYGNLDLTMMRPAPDSEYSKKHREISKLIRRVGDDLDLVELMQLEDGIIALEEIVGRLHLRYPNRSK